MVYIKKTTTALKQLTVLGLGFILFFIGMVNFFLGFHSLDTGHNMKVAENTFNTTVYDITSNRMILTSTEVYIKGVNDVFNGYVLSIMGMLFLGMAYMDLLYKLGGKT